MQKRPKLANEKCRACTHYVLQWSYIADGYVEGCSAGEKCSFENKRKILKKKQMAFIKRR